MTPWSQTCARRRLVALLVTSLLSGCEGTPGSDGGLDVGGTWQLAGEPTLTIGEGLASPESALHLVHAAVRLPDGRVVVADGAFSPRLSVFSSDGRWISSVGSSGEGPGEFRFLTSLQVGPADSLVVFDAALGRVTVFPQGEGQPRTVPVGVTTNLRGIGLLSVVRMAHGNTWVGRGRPRMDIGEPGVLMRDTISVGLFDGNLATFRVLADLPDQITTTVAVAGQRAYGQAAFSPEVLHAVWGRCVFVAQADRPRISVFDADGDRVALFDGPGTLRAVTAEHLEARAEGIRARFGNSAEAEVALLQFERQAKTEHLPFYSALVLDQWGHIWLQEYQPPWGKGERWFVLSQTGAPLAEVSMPRGMWAFEITEQGVLGRSYGELHEEIVQLFPFSERPPRSAAPLPACSPS